ncbi:MAG: cytochrome C assembly protein, partial [Coriobacteriia bacterium]|nr:cytochrome C assembly protein [Coriobacteriia bacterium]
MQNATHILESTPGAPVVTNNRLSLPALVLGALLTTAGFLMAFFTAPLVAGAKVDTPALIGGRMVTSKLLLSQKIFYFHVPVALVSFIALGFA